MDGPRLIRDEQGFTLVEVLMTILILLVGLAGAVTLTVGANAATSRTQAREAGTNLNRELVEAARSVPYAQLTPNGLRAALQARPGLADSTPADPAWTIERRGTTFTLSPTVCSVDDRRDGYGVHSSGTFCSNPTATSPPDDNPDDYKRVGFEIEWGGRGGTPVSRARQTTLINPSNSAGPRINPFTANTDLVMVTSSSPITFTAQTETPATAVRFDIDGNLAATDATGGTTATFAWAVADVVDGTYVVSATALDSAGLMGATRSLTVRLNIRPPAAPTGLVGGWNATRSAVDLDWNQNPESDIVGYRVFRTPAGGATQQVCATGPKVTTCHDATPPIADSYAYYVVALDEQDSSGTKRPGPASEIKTVVPTTLAPNPPATLQASVVDGANRLDWTAPVAQAYLGGEIRFFRIYRDGKEVARRYDRTGLGTDLTFTDTDVAGQPRQYWVTAVDQNYSESLPIGPVSLP
jgi:prepilin-type N-terminal cleavage/methylation domain-containing protein